MSREKIRNWAVIILAFGFAIAAVIYVSRNREVIEDLLVRLGIFGPLLVILLYVILAMSPIPADALALITGSVFAPVAAFSIVLAGSVCAALVEYYVGTRMRDATEFDEFRENLPWNLNKLPVESPLFLIGGRMMTSVGSKMVSYLSGMYRVNLWRYVWTTTIAVSFGALFYVLGGFGLTQLF